MRIVGVELGGTKCVCALGNMEGEILTEVRIATGTPSETLASIEDVLDGWRLKLGFARLGIASFGPINIDPSSSGWGEIATTPKPGWSGVNVGQRLRDRYGVPTRIHTDVVGAALAEMFWGAGRGLTDVAYVTVGTGVGAGIISAGRPLDGFSHSELGHIRPQRLPADDWPGSCPFHGDCVEGLVSGQAIAARLAATKRTALEESEWVWVAATLGQLLHTIVLTCSPRRIVMGGGVMQGQPHLFPMIRESLSRSLASYLPVPELQDGLDDYVVPPGLGQQAGPCGALALAL